MKLYRYTLLPSIQGRPETTLLVEADADDAPALVGEFPSHSAARDYVMDTFEQRGLKLEWTPNSNLDPYAISSPWIQEVEPETGL